MATSLKKIRVILRLLAILILFELFFVHTETFAQMRLVYPKKFSISGLIELTYKDYSTETSNGHDHKSSYSVLQQRYSLALKGYIYHPKLAVFTTRVTFIDYKTLSSTSVLKPETKSLIYEMSAIFLPYRPVSLTTYAMRSAFTVGGLPTNPYDNTIMNYGALLFINLRKLPSIRFEYYHLDVTPQGSQQNKKKTKNDSYYLNIKGTLNPIRTQYSLNFGFSNISTAIAERKTKFADIYANTGFKKFSLINFFHYYDQEISKTLGIYSNLQFNRGKRFLHDYYYSYAKFEETFNDTTTNRVKHDIRGFFSYRILTNLNSSLSLNYGLNKDEDGKWKYYAISTALNYSRPVKSLYLVSFYRFIVKNDEKLGKFNEHLISLDLTTRQFRWGRLFTSYNFTILDGMFKIQPSQESVDFGIQEEPQEGKYKTTTHTLIIGTRGRAFTRASWSAEAEYIHSDSTKERPKKYFDYSDFSDSDILKTERKRNYYVLVGEIMYPLGRRGANLNLRTGYNFGESDSKEFKKLYYELKLILPIARRLSLSSWWREAWYAIGGNPDRKVREYQILVNYGRGQLRLSVEYWVTVEEEETRKREDTRLILKAKRFF